MDFNNLYQACLKMINDKYNLNDFSKDIFTDIYNNVYKNSDLTIPNNNLNKQVLVEIKNYIESKLNKDIDIQEEDLELKIKEIEAIRNAISKMPPINSSTTIESEIQTTPILNQIQIPTFQPSISQLPQMCKTFIINTTKNNFKVTLNVDIKNHSIYPECICLPSDIKNKTPYIILHLNDGIKQISYSYIPINVYNLTWDIWKPIINDYIDITLTNNNWIITMIDYLNTPIDLNEYQVIVNDVLMVNNNYTLNINKPHYFSINDKIKIIKNNGIVINNIITDINNNIITINKNNLILEDFIDSKIINYKHNISLTFKYHIKQQ